MNPLISPEEAEKAASQYAKKFEFECSENRDACEVDFKKGIEAANTKYNESVTPVLVKCKEALEKAKEHIYNESENRAIEEIESTLQTINSLLQ